MQKIYRLKKGYQFNYLYKKGESIANREMVLLFAKNRTKTLQVGVSVGKKIGKSVVRSRTKRLIKESFRLMIPFVDGHYNYVVIARQGIEKATYREVYNSLQYLLKKSGKMLLKND